MLKNVLSISTAGKNRYLFFFNSHHSLTQWTAGIRLALFELAMLQEAYTGALIGSKAKSLNGINTIMQRTRFKYEDWARVRFAAGEPWNKYWAVITPPDEKLYQKWKKEMKKGKQPREPLVLGNIKFYATKKTKKAIPVATITKAYSCYALYPQSEGLIEHSTLVKIEGQITTQNADESREGFVFVMPDTHPSITGFEMMIRWLFPTFDAFHLYGRPQRLAADVMDIRSLMFAMPRDAKYGYLEVADVANLISADKKRIVSEVEWRQKLKELTLKKMQIANRGPRNSLPSQTRISATVFDENRSSASSSPAVPYPPQHVPMTPSIPLTGKHHRSMSEAQGYVDYQGRTTIGNPPYERPSTAFAAQRFGADLHTSSNDAGSEVPSDEDNELFNTRYTRYPQIDLPENIPSTPTMAHIPSSRPPHPLPATPGHQSRMSIPTLETLARGAVAGPASHRERSYQTDAQNGQGEDYPPRKSHESNMFEDLPLSRTRWSSNAIQGSDLATEWSSGGRSYTPSPRHPLPSPPCEDLRNNHDRHSPSPAPDPPRHMHLRSSNDFRPILMGITPPSNDEQKPFLWEQEKGKLGGNRPSPLDLNQASSMMDYLPSPPDPAKFPLTTSSTPRPPAWQTGRMKETDSTPQTSPDKTLLPTDSTGSLAHHVMSAEALNRVSQNFARMDSAEDMAIVKQAPKMTGTYSESGSEYENDEIDDYASSDAESGIVKLPRRVDGARAGVMKTVGQRKADDINGDRHYNSTSQDREISTTTPKVDFGRTINHGRSLSFGTNSGLQNLHMRTMSRGNGHFTDAIHDAHTEYTGSVVNSKGMSQNDPEIAFPGVSHNRIPSNGSATFFDEARRFQHTRQYSSPEPGSMGDSRGVLGTEHKPTSLTGRNMAWQPGLVQQPGSNNKLANRSETPERYVAEQAAAAKQQSQARNRYVHSRRPSRNSSTEHIPRPLSRGGNAAFSPHGLISAPDLSSHLSAREQEYIARKTGTTLLQMENGNSRKQPPHQAGLLGALEAREKEKREMSNNITVQQALAQRQLHARTVSSSSRGTVDASGRVLSQQFQQGFQPQQQPMQPEFNLQQSQLLFGQYQQHQNHTYGNQGAHGQFNGR